VARCPTDMPITRDLAKGRMSTLANPVASPAPTLTSPRRTRPAMPAAGRALGSNGANPAPTPRVIRATSGSPATSPQLTSAGPANPASMSLASRIRVPNSATRQ
jgi:hypothetical protein